MIDENKKSENTGVLALYNKAKKVKVEDFQKKKDHELEEDNEFRNRIGVKKGRGWLKNQLQRPSARQINKRRQKHGLVQNRYYFNFISIKVKEGRKRRNEEELRFSWILQGLKKLLLGIPPGLYATSKAEPNMHPNPANVDQTHPQATISLEIKGLLA